MSPAIRHWFRRTWLRELLIAALLLQALIPAGYMPGVSTEGGATLQLCSLGHLLGAAAAPDSRAPDDDGNGETGRADHGWCPFAGGIHLPPLNTRVTYAIVASVSESLPATEGLTPIYTVAARTQLPRGPPALS